MSERSFTASCLESFRGAGPPSNSAKCLTSAAIDAGHWPGGASNPAQTSACNGTTQNTSVSGLLRRAAPAALSATALFSTSIPPAEDDTSHAYSKVLEVNLCVWGWGLASLRDSRLCLEGVAREGDQHHVGGAEREGRRFL